MSIVPQVPGFDFNGDGEVDLGEYALGEEIFFSDDDDVKNPTAYSTMTGTTTSSATTTEGTISEPGHGKARGYRHRARLI